MTNQMQWINALSTRPSLEGAVTEVVEKIQKSLSVLPDLGILFISSTYASDYSRLIPLILEKLPLPLLIGCSGGGIVGINGSSDILEVEGKSALSLTVAVLPGVKLKGFHLMPENLPDLDASPQTWSQLVGVSPQENPHFILLSEPLAPKMTDLVEGLDFAYPQAVKVGGLASTSMINLPSALFYYQLGKSDPDLYHQGTVGVALSGNIVVESIVAQGCRPIGQPYQVSQGDRNIILKLEQFGENGPPLHFLRDLMSNLSEHDRQLAQHSLFIGVVRDEFTQELQPGDFLIRNFLGVDPRLGAIAIGDRVRPGQRIQFHLRDAQTSAEDLELLLQAYSSGNNSTNSIKGALMFSCLGRGEMLYGVPNFDSQLFRHYFPQIPLGGFFCHGEIGPVGKQTFLHGYTSALAIFRQPN
ncbi:FIST signal transduction protein [Aphanothece sacrum]|nr:FIST C-terminal domain-containing protein [Aphanothece sacrum]